MRAQPTSDTRVSQPAGPETRRPREFFDGAGVHCRRVAGMPTLLRKESRPVFLPRLPSLTKH
jgi:hypothetical protein